MRCGPTRGSHCRSTVTRRRVACSCAEPPKWTSSRASPRSSSPRPGAASRPRSSRISRRRYAASTTRWPASWSPRPGCGSTTSCAPRLSRSSNWWRRSPRRWSRGGRAEPLGERPRGGARVVRLGDRPDDDGAACAAGDDLVEPLERLDAADREPGPIVLVLARVLDQVEAGRRPAGLRRRRPGRAAAVVGDAGFLARRVGLLRRVRRTTDEYIVADYLPGD